MLYQQLRVLTFMVVALARLSTAATFTCDNQQGYVECSVSLGTGNSFLIIEGGGSGCSNDGQYCAELESVSDEKWKFFVTNGGASCATSCPPLIVECDSSRCWSGCQIEAC